MAKPPSNVHLIVGEDDYLVEQTARRLIAAAVPEELRASAVETVAGAAEAMDGQLAALGACRASVETPPFLDPVKVTWWRNVTFLPGGGGRAVANDVKTALERFAKTLAANPLPPNQQLIVTAPGLLMTSVFAKTFKSFAEVVQFASGKRARDRRENALVNLPDLAKEEGLSFAPGADEAFVAKVGTDTRTIISELQKIRTYLEGDKPVVTAQVINDIASPGGEEPELWDLTDAVGQRNVARTLFILKGLMGEKSVGILLATILEKYFRELIVVRDAVDRKYLTLRGWARDLPADVIADLDATGLGPNAESRSFVLRTKAVAAQNYTMRELRVARHRLMQAREALVSSSATDDLVTTELIRIVSRPRR